MADAKTIPALRIRSCPESFFRAGRRWTREPQTIAVTEFTKTELALLRAEPLLVVENVNMPVPEAEGN